VEEAGVLIAGGLDGIGVMMLSFFTGNFFSGG
jgi:hypothetical protein